MNTANIIANNIPFQTPANIVVEISSIIEARNNIKRIKKNVKNSSLSQKEKLIQQVESAKKEASIFGMYDDCGSFYEEEYKNAQSNLEYFENNFSGLIEKLVILPEKQVKFRIHQFKENNADYAHLLDNVITEINKESQRLANYKEKLKGAISQLSFHVFNIIIDNDSFGPLEYGSFNVTKKTMINEMVKNEEKFHNIVDYILKNEVENYLLAEKQGLSIMASNKAREEQANKNKKRYESKLKEIKKLYKEYNAL